MNFIATVAWEVGESGVNQEGESDTATENGTSSKDSLYLSLPHWRLLLKGKGIQTREILRTHILKLTLM